MTKKTPYAKQISLFRLSFLTAKPWIGIGDFAVQWEDENRTSKNVEDSEERKHEKEDLETVMNEIYKKITINSLKRENI